MFPEEVATVGNYMAVVISKAIWLSLVCYSSIATPIANKRIRIKGSLLTLWLWELLTALAKVILAFRTIWTMSYMLKDQII